ncbi:MAG: hypothetical protein JXA94_03685 [Parachlamydiales bacterium]|nr:hypothetical protein [Parachlamydiales bacterium]
MATSLQGHFLGTQFFNFIKNPKDKGCSGIKIFNFTGNSVRLSAYKVFLSAKIVNLCVQIVFAQSISNLNRSDNFRRIITVLKEKCCEFYEEEKYVRIILSIEAFNEVVAPK